MVIDVDEETILRKLEVMLTRVDERVNNFLTSNKEDHAEIIADIKDLKLHVNDEVAKMDRRIMTLEQGVISLAAKKKESDADAKKWKIIIGAVAAGIVTILTALHTMGLF
jgi:CHASE3 domain sensor protein